MVLDEMSENDRLLGSHRAADIVINFDIIKQHGGASICEVSKLKNVTTERQEREQNLHNVWRDSFSSAHQQH